MAEPTTIEQLMDWHARRAGWEPFIASNGDNVWHRGEAMEGTYEQSVDANHHLVHPIAPTIDAAVRAMPDGYWWVRGRVRYNAQRKDRAHVTPLSVPITGHTPEAIRHDLLALARLAWIEEGATP